MGLVLIRTSINSTKSQVNIFYMHSDAARGRLNAMSRDRRSILFFYAPASCDPDERGVVTTRRRSA